MNPTDREDLEAILHRLIVDIAKDKEVFYRMSTKESFAQLCVMMRHLFQPRKEELTNVRNHIHQLKKD